MRASILLAIMASATLASQAVAREPSNFDIALNNRDYLEAAKEIENISSKGRLGANLDYYYGRFFAAVGQNSIAEPYLLRAIASAKDPEGKDILAFELARVREVDGAIDEALVGYRQLAASNSMAPVRRDAILSIARLRLSSAPEESISLLSALIAEGKGDAGLARWEALLLLSRAYAVSGRSADSRAALATAWQEAPRAPSAADAIAITAMDMGLDRMNAGDREGEIDLMATGKMDDSFAGTSQLPVCGASLRPDDSVTIAIQADSRQRPIYSAVRASRPGIAQLFTVPLAAVRQQLNGPALYVTVRCRATLDMNIGFPGGATRTLPSWLAEKGYYPPLRPFDPSNGNLVAELTGQLQRLESKWGKDSAVLTPTLLQISFMQGAQSRFSNTGNFAAAKGTAERALNILTRAGAPTEVLEQTRIQTTLAFAQNDNIADVAGPASLEVLTSMASRPETTPAQALTVFNGMARWQLRPTQRLALADRLLAFFDERGLAPTDQMRQAVELRRSGILRDIGTVAGMRDRLTKNGIAADLCNVADRKPSIPPAAITLTSEDYPKDLIRRNITGLTAVELSLDATGKIAEQRIIVSQPPQLFDGIATSKLKSLILFPAQRDEQSVSCAGFVQTVRWQMPFQGDYSGSFNSFPFSPE